MRTVGDGFPCSQRCSSRMSTSGSKEGVDEAWNFGARGRRVLDEMITLRRFSSGSYLLLLLPSLRSFVPC